jgi:hypothetical protein
LVADVTRKGSVGGAQRLAAPHEHPLAWPEAPRAAVLRGLRPHELATQQRPGSRPGCCERAQSPSFPPRRHPSWLDVLTPPRPRPGTPASCWPWPFEINPLHNLVHLAIGLAGLALWRRLDTARTYGWLLAAGYGLTFLYGLFAAGNSDINFLSINGADNGLHLISAAAGLAIALWPAQRTARRGVADRGA